jgi:hypothetical protein
VGDRKEMNMPRFLVLIPVLLVAALMFIASEVQAAKLLCISKEEIKGEETVGSCLAHGHEFAIVEDNGVVHVLTRREVALTKLFNPKLFEQRAYGLRYRELAPEINNPK